MPHGKKSSYNRLIADRNVVIVQNVVCKVLPIVFMLGVEQ